MHFSALAWQTQTNVESNAHLKSNKAPIYAIKGLETASAKFLKVLFSWAQTGRLFLCTNTFKNLQIFEFLNFVSVTYQTRIVKQKIVQKDQLSRQKAINIQDFICDPTHKLTQAKVPLFKLVWWKSS